MFASVWGPLRAINFRIPSIHCERCEIHEEAEWSDDCRTDLSDRVESVSVALQVAEVVEAKNGVGVVVC